MCGEYGFEKFKNGNKEMLLEFLSDEEKSLITEMTPQDFDRDHARYLKAMLQMREITEDPNEKSLEKFAELNKELQENKHEYPLTAITLPTLSSSFKKHHIHQTKLKFNMLSMKLKEFHNQNGSYPESLEQLEIEKEIFTDTLSGVIFDYQVNGESIKLSPKTDFGKYGKSLPMEFKLD